jgi:hypothetical protein
MGGCLDDAWWSYSYSPLFGDDGQIAGILVVATEKTAEVRGRKLLEAAKMEAELARSELHGVFMQAPLPMALLKGPDHRFTLVNAPYRALVGGRDLDGRTVREVFSEAEVGYYLPHLDRVYATGEPMILQELPYTSLIQAASYASDSSTSATRHIEIRSPTRPPESSRSFRTSRTRLRYARANRACGRARKPRTARRTSFSRSSRTS